MPKSDTQTDGSVHALHAEDVAYIPDVTSHARPSCPTDVDKMLNQLRSFFNGTFVESFDATVTSDGATITMAIEKSGGGDLTMSFSDGQFPFTATSTTLTPGTDEVPKEQYVYILQSGHPTITISDSDWPSAEHIRIAAFYLPSATLVQARGGAFVNQNINDHLMATDTGQGHLSHIGAHARHLGARWHEGCEGVATQDGNDLWVSISVGVVHQMHEHAFAALDSDTDGAGDPIYVINDPDSAFAEINSLNEITKRSDGVAIGINKFVKFVLWGVANKEDTFSPMMLNLPSNEYNLASAAASDASNYSNTAIPRIFGCESSTGFLIAALVCKHTATAMEIEETIDLRGSLPDGSAGGGGTGGDVTAATTLTDNAMIVGDGGGKGIKDNGVVAIKGSIIVGNSAPDWDELGIGANGDILVADSAETNGLKWSHIPITISRVFYIENPVTGDEYPLSINTAHPITITEVYGEVDAATFANFNLKHRARGDLFTAGTEIITTDVNATTSGDTETDFDDATIPAGNVVFYIGKTVSGAPTKVICIVTYTIDK